LKRILLDRVLRRLRNRRIGVIQGGSSMERSISLKTGAAVRQALASWGLRALPVEARGDIAGRLRCSRIDFAYLAVHGSPGEDGTLQGLLEMMGISYTGSGVLASALAMNKPLAKAVFRQAGVPTPPWREIACHPERSEGSRRKQHDEILRSVHSLRMTLPVVVKPAQQGSALGVTVVQKRNRLSRALSHALSFGSRALIEKYIPGTEVTVGVLGSDPLPVVEIIPAHRFYDFYSKYNPGGSRHLVPARLSYSTLSRVRAAALRAFSALHCRAYGRVDLIVSREGTPYVLEVNTIPGMTSVSLLPDAARAAGISFEELVLRIIEHSLSDPA
jgi:D-alanine-D-alanine ligase